MSVVWYSATFLGYSRHKLEKIDVDWLCLSRSDSDRGLIGVQDTVEKAILGLRYYVRKSKRNC